MENFSIKQGLKANQNTSSTRATSPPAKQRRPLQKRGDLCQRGRGCITWPSAYSRRLSLPTGLLPRQQIFQRPPEQPEQTFTSARDAARSDFEVSDLLTKRLYLISALGNLHPSLFSGDAFPIKSTLNSATFPSAVSSASAASRSLSAVKVSFCSVRSAFSSSRLLTSFGECRGLFLCLDEGF